eukprot:g12817.t1
MSTFREAIPRELGQPPSNVQGRALTIGWSCEGKLATGTTVGWVVLADVDSHGNARAKSSFAAHKSQDGVEELKWHPTDRHQLATCSLDKTLKVWDVRKPGSKPTQEYKSGGENFTLDYSPDGHYIAMGGTQRDKNMETDILGIYDTRTKKKIRSVKFSTYKLERYMWSPNGNYILGSNDQGSIDAFLFSTTKLSLVRSTKCAHTASCKTLEFDPLNRYLASGGDDGLVALWELDDFVCVRTIECEGEVASVSFSPDGRFLAMSMSINSLEIAEVATGARAHALPAPAGGFSAIKFHPKRPLLAAVCHRSPNRGDFGLRLWSCVY